jgi:cytochrome b561
MFPNTIESWGTPAKLLHWIMAALVLAQFVLGWTASKWRLSPLKLELFVWHKSIGMLILGLLMLRIFWRLANPTPAMPGDTPAWERRAARISHVLLYLLLIAMPVTGWIVNSAANIPFRIFWLIPLPAIAEPAERTADLAKLAHLALFVVLSAMLLVHIGAALRHHYVKGNDVLTRMLPGGSGRA